MSVHVDVSDKVNEIKPLCGRSLRGDYFTYWPEDELNIFPHTNVTCPKCLSILEKVKAGVVLTHAKAEAV